MSEITSALKGIIPCASEYDLCLRIDAALDAAGIEFIKERRMAKDIRLDYYIPHLQAGIEVKTGGSPLAINRQCMRYLQNPDILTLYLVTRKALKLPSVEYTRRDGSVKHLHVIELWKNAL